MRDIKEIINIVRTNNKVIIIYKDEKYIIKNIEDLTKEETFLYHYYVILDNLNATKDVLIGSGKLLVQTELNIENIPNTAFNNYTLKINPTLEDISLKDIIKTQRIIGVKE